MADVISEGLSNEEKCNETNGEMEENGETTNEFDEEINDEMFDDPEGFVDNISDEG